jgi:O-antigen ligase
VPLSAFTVVCTFSRGGFLALAATALGYAALQRRRVRPLAALALAGGLAVMLVPLPEGYLDRLGTIQTYEEQQDESALSRLHFWRVAVDMAVDRPLGVGLFNFEREYDGYDPSEGLYGRERSVHSSYFQALAETGVLGLAVFLWLFVHAFRLLARVRARARAPEMPDEWRGFLVTTANGLVLSMVGFLVGGAFLSAALNDVTWLTFGLVAALDRISRRLTPPGNAASALPGGRAAAVAPAGPGPRPAGARVAAC